VIILNGGVHFFDLESHLCLKLLSLPLTLKTMAIMINNIENTNQYVLKSKYGIIKCPYPFISE
jgi:hypothetical protein